MSLEGFVKARPVRANPGQAWCCRLPAGVRAEVEQAVASGVRNWKAISDWLRSEGFTDATPSKVQYHFDRQHPTAGGAA